MFHDLNVPYTANQAELQRTLAFIAELGYNTVALSHHITGKIPADLTSPIPSPLPFPTPKSLRLLTRCTLTLSDPSQNHRLTSLAANYTLLAIRPNSEKSLQQACLSLSPIDLISLDCGIRYPFYFKQKQLGAAIERGVRFEICYAVGILGTGEQRRNLISNATQLIRATRGRGIVISGEAGRALACRGPWDVVNLAAGWGLGRERGVEALQREARSVIIGAEMRKSSFRGAVDVVFGGVKGEDKKGGVEGKGKDQVKQSGKRKAEDNEMGEEVEKPLSKREMKRRKKKARMEMEIDAGDDNDNTTEASMKVNTDDKVTTNNEKNND